MLIGSPGVEGAFANSGRGKEGRVGGGGVAGFTTLLGKFTEISTCKFLRSLGRMCQALSACFKTMVAKLGNDAEHRE